MKIYNKPEFEIIKIRLTKDILSASQEETVPIYTDEPVTSYDPFPSELPPLGN